MAQHVFLKKSYPLLKAGYRLLSCFSCASASIISSFLLIIHHLLTNTYKPTSQTVDPKGEEVRGLHWIPACPAMPMILCDTDSRDTEKPNQFLFCHNCRTRDEFTI